MLYSPPVLSAHPVEGPSPAGDALKVGVWCPGNKVDSDHCVDIFFGYPAYSHHDKFPPWWVFVRDDYGGNLSGDKIPP